MSTEEIRPPGPIGFIGIGAMGRPMTNSLLGAGYEMVCYDPSGPALDQVVQDGAQRATSAAGVAQQARVVFTMLPTAADVRAALLGEDGAADGARDGAIFIDTSTIDPMTIRSAGEALADKGIMLLDGGVSGSPPMAWASTLTLMMGGDEKSFARCEHMLASLCANLIYTGELGSAKVVKLINNMVGAVTMASVAEGFQLGEKAGLDPSILFEAMMGSWGRCLNLELRPPVPGLVEGSPADSDFEADFSVDYMVKDLSCALATAEALGQSVPIAEAGLQLYAKSKSLGDGPKDISAVGRAIA